MRTNKHVHFDENIHEKLSHSEIKLLYGNSSIIKRVTRGLEKNQTGRTLQFLIENATSGVTTWDLLASLRYVTPSQGVFYARQMIKNIGLIIVSESESGPNIYGENTSWDRFFIARRIRIQK